MREGFITLRFTVSVTVKKSRIYEFMVMLVMVIVTIGAFSTEHEHCELRYYWL